MEILRQEAKYNDSEIWGVVSYFNPVQYKNKKKNFDIFRRGIKNQGLPILSIELAFYDRSFELTQKDGEIVVYVRSNSIMWQKERLYNIAINHLPEHCRFVVFLDADIIFQNPDWVSQTVSLLDQYPVVQPFQYNYQLGKNEDYSSLTDNKLALYKGPKIRRSSLYSLKEFYTNDNINTYGAGLSWAFRRDFLNKIGGWYDRSIIGGVDTLLSFSLLGLVNQNYIKKSRPYLGNDCLTWSEKVYKHAGRNFHYTSGNLLDLWHGDTKNRFYIYRHKILHSLKFDPQKDLMINKDQCWEWNTSNQRLIKWTKNYFYARNEERTLYSYIYTILFTLERTIWRLRLDEEQE